MRKIFSLLTLAFMIFYAAVVSAQSSWRVESGVSKNFAREVLDLVNVERQKENLPPLKLARDLNHYAQIRAKEITKKFSHTRPNGKDPFTVVNRNYSTYSLMGENIAAGQISPKDVVAAWMNSPTHRENILRPQFQKLGVGYVYVEGDRYKHYWAQLFGMK